MISTAIKKFLVLFLIFCASPLKGELGLDLEVRSDVFFPADKHFRDVYSYSCFSYGLELATPVSTHLEGWVNVDWFSKKGHSIPLHSPTQIQVVTTSLGFKCPYQLIECLSAYLGFGASFCNLWIKNKDPSLEKRSYSTPYSTLGLVVKSGLIWDVSDCLFCDIFADYLYQPHYFHKHRVNLGGLKLGLGLGIRF